jgi:heptosyltransferase II
VARHALPVAGCSHRTGAARNTLLGNRVGSTAVIQTKQGIGDVVWHLPFIRAIAAASPGGAVTFLTLSSTRAREILAAESCVEKTIYFENRGSELKRGVQIIGLIRTLRRLRCSTVWVLDRSARPAFCALLAGVRNRIGVGLGPQRLFITNPGIDQRLAHEMPIEWLRALMTTMGIECGTEPELRLPARVVAAMDDRFGGLARPWVVLALGGSHPAKDWPMSHWVEFATALRRTLSGTVFVIGGPEHAARAADLIEASAKGCEAAAVNVCQLSIVEAAALIKHAQVFIGPDSGPMNLAVAVGTPAVGLFGATRVLRYSRLIDPVRPDDDGPPTMDGMRRISPRRVLERVEPYLGPPFGARA